MFKSIEENHNYINFFKETIEQFGGINSRVKTDKEKYVFRNNTKSDDNKGAYFACINKYEEPTGPYSDLSIVICPSNEQNDIDDRWIISFGVGSLGYKDDFSIASLPGTRRLFIKHLKNTKSFIKNDFLDIESDDGFNSFYDELANDDKPDTLRNAVGTYPKLLLTGTLFNPNNEEETKNIISKYLALYATLRHWPYTNPTRKAVEEALNKEQTQTVVDDETIVRNLIKTRKYVVLQGAPGTGKTRLAKRIPEGNAKVFFTQFHAETTYSDFIYGIIPNVEAENLKYKSHEGIFVEAIRSAQSPENKGKNVYLIIDEINRANLSNVLGSCFYLFEPTMANSNVEIEICPGLKLNRLPDNLYVIATMNTADRSLAVVDFALRRRFAWYTLLPHKITLDKDNYFYEDDFNKIADIFELYASDEELNLQPGHAYFIVKKINKEQEFEDRLRYEIMPLIKEYLLDGMLARAKDDFVNYFRNRIGEEMFK